MATTLDTYLPFDAGAGANVTEDQWRAMALHFLGSGPLRGEDNEMAPYGDSSGMQVKVKTGKAFVRGHYGENTSEKILPIAAVGGIAGGQSRLDRVVLRADFVNNRIELDVVAGTPAATGTQVAPALVQSSSMWEISLGTVGPLTNATVTIAAGTVTDGRVLVVSHSGEASALTAYTPTDTGITVGNGTRTAVYRMLDAKTCYFRWLLSLGSTSAIATDAAIGLPFGTANLVPFPVVYRDSSAGLFVPGSAYGLGLSATLMQPVAASNAGKISATVPFTWALNDTIAVSGVYDLA